MTTHEARRDLARRVLDCALAMADAEAAADGARLPPEARAWLGRAAADVAEVAELLRKLAREGGD